MTMKSRLAIVRELRRVERKVRSKKDSDDRSYWDDGYVKGAQQALTWVLQQNAWRPTR